MTTEDLITIIGNLSQSLYPIQKLITGFAYLLGIVFILKALMLFKKIGASSQERPFTGVMFLFFGAILLYLPTALNVAANTAFGVGNVISYTNYNPTNIYSSMGLLIQTGGLLWFVRGCVLVAQASQPGSQHGAKGLLFIIAGIFAINFDNTISMVNSIVDYIVHLSITVQTSQGY